MKNKTNFVIDSVIFLGFLAASIPALTGLALHEWLSLALAGTLLVHLVVHADWAWSVLSRFFKKLWHSSRLNFVVNLVLLVAYVGVMLSGVLISRELLNVLGIQLNESRTWEQIHRLTADAAVWLTALHFALHWRWILNACKHYLVEPIRRLLNHRTEPMGERVVPTMEPVKVEIRTDR